MRDSARDSLDAYRHASERVRLVEVHYKALPPFRVEVWKSLKSEMFDCVVQRWDEECLGWRRVKEVTQSDASSDEAFERTMIRLKAHLESSLGKDELA
jgi:hypothetical protein